MENNLKQLAVVLVILVAMLVSGFLLLKYFYPTVNPATDTKHKDVSLNDSTDTGSEETDPVIDSVLSYKSNLTLESIKNSKYLLKGSIEAVFTEGSFKGRESMAGESVDSEVRLFDFGDINGDESGDAVVVTTTSVGSLKYDELHAVINDKGQTRTSVLIPILESGYEVSRYSHVAISNKKIILEMEVASAGGGMVRKSGTYILSGGNLVADSKKTAWKKYTASEFGFELSYPEGSPLQVRPIIENGKDISETLRVSVTMPFTTNYNTWNQKFFTLFAKPGACPYRHEAEIITRNGISWHIYDPSNTMTSDPEKNLRMREYMAYEGKYCYTAVLSIEGPGPKSPNFPKEAEARFPDNLDNFFGLEFVILEQMLDTFKFL